MKKLILPILLLFSMSFIFGLSTTKINNKTSKKPSRIQVFGAKQSYSTLAPTSATVGSVTVTGPGWYRIAGYTVGTAITTVNAITGGTAGDVIIVQSSIASTDIVLLIGTSLELAANRTLSDPADAEVLLYDGSKWMELRTNDNN